MKYPLHIFVSILLLCFVSIGAYVYFVRSDDTATQWECDQDGKVCSDGTIVGRTGPRCEFTACPGVLPVTE